MIAVPELLKFFRREQDRRPEDNKLNVFDLLTLYIVHKHDVGGLYEESSRRLQKAKYLEINDGRYTILGSYVDEYADVAVFSSRSTCSAQHAERKNVSTI